MIHDGVRIAGHGFSGEMGHFVVNHEGEYKRLEHIVSGTGIRRSGEAVYGENVSTEDVFNRYKSGEREASEIIETSAAYFSESIYSLIALLDPEKIVFGGSVMVHQPEYLTLIKEKLEPMMLEGHKHVLDNMTIIRSDGKQGAAGAGMQVFRSNRLN